MHAYRHYFAAVAAFAIWGFFPWVLRSLTAYTAGEILYFRILFSVLALIAAVLAFRYSHLREDISRIRRMPSRARLNAILLMLAGGALLTVNWLIFIYTVNEVNIKTASFSYLVCPVMTAVLGYLLLGEKLSLLQWLAVALCLVSCVLMGINNIDELGYSMTIAVTYGSYLVLQRKNLELDRMTVLGVQIIFSFFLLTIFSGYLVDDVPSGFAFHGTVLVIAVVFTVLPLFLNLFALIRINSATVGILMYINPLINFTIAVLVFGEQISSLQLVGYSIIVVALVLFNYQVIGRLRAA